VYGGSVGVLELIGVVYKVLTRMST
jgi:hypothetical protein